MSSTMLLNAFAATPLISVASNIAIGVVAIGLFSGLMYVPPLKPVENVYEDVL